LEKVINLINGKIRTENKFNQITNNILSHPKFSGKTISLKLNLDIDLKNHWLAGFSDASATFQIKLITRTDQEQPDWTLIPSSNSKALPAETRIVVWGQILSSSVGLGRYTKQVSNMIRIPAYQQSVITGLILSDGWLIFSSKTSKSARLGFKQSLSNSAYFLFLFSLLSPYYSTIPSFISSKRKETNTYALQIFTRSLPCFTELLSIYYPNGIKRIPADIFNLLTPIALAHWIMGDGNKNRHGLTISTESFSLNDTVRLINVLMIRYRLDCTMRQKSPGYTIYITEKSMPLLRTLVQPHMHSSMLYKLRMNTDVKYTTQVNLSEDISSKRHDLVKLTTKDDASFQIKILNRNRCSKPLASATGKSKKVEIRLNFQIDQKKDVLLLLIKNFLGGNIGYRNLLDNYTYNSDSYGSARKIIKYFDSYHLLSHKYLDFLRWRKTYVLLQMENGLTDKDKMRIKNFASKLSINRTNTFLGFSSLAVLQSAHQGNYSGLNSCFLNKGCRKFSTSLLVKQSSNFSSQPQSSALNPYWITGFGDGESSFTISIIKDSKYKLGWAVKPSYRIGLHQKDSDLLVRIKAFFGVGNIIKDRKTNMVYFVVSPLADLTNVIIPHFLEYPLLTQKRADFLLFKSIIDMINSKEHLDSEGLTKIVGIRYSINRGLSTTLLEAFPDAYPVDKPKMLVPLTIDPNWLIGFTDGEGCFNIHITSSKTHVIGVQVKVRFILTQHSRDIDLMQKLVQILGCGGLSLYSGEKPAINLVVSKFADINTKIISLIKKYPLQSSKRLEFGDFCLVVV